MSTIDALEAGPLLPQLMERVARGESITLTKEGVAVARLVPAGPRPDAEAAVRELLEFRKAHPIDGTALRELIEEGRHH